MVVGRWEGRRTKMKRTGCEEKSYVNGNEREKRSQENGWGRETTTKKMLYKG